MPFNKTVNTTNNTAVTMKTASIAAFTEGRDSELQGVRTAVVGSVTGISTTEKPMLTVRNRTHYQGKENRVSIRLVQVNASADGNKTVEFFGKAGATLTGASFSDVATTTSVLQTDTTASAISGGTTIGSVTFPQSGVLSFPLVAEEIFLNPGEQVTFSGVAIATASVDMATGVTFIEQF